MKKTNKKLSVKVESIRTLTSDALSSVAGGLPPGSKLGSGCVGCGTNSLDCSAQQTCASGCVTLCASVCGGTCIYC